MASGARQSPSGHASSDPRILCVLDASAAPQRPPDWMRKKRGGAETFGGCRAKRATSTRTFATIPKVSSKVPIYVLSASRSRGIASEGIGGNVRGVAPSAVPNTDASCLWCARTRRREGAAPPSKKHSRSTNTVGPPLLPLPPSHVIRASTLE